ncbi:unnamed protein product, partial [marine sediment metagenome]
SVSKVKIIPEEAKSLLTIFIIPTERVFHKRIG